QGVGPGLAWRPEAVAPDQPLVVVSPSELARGVGQLRDSGEGPHPEEVLLQGPDEPLGTTVPLRLADEARRAVDPEEGQLPLEVVAHVGAAMVVADGQPRGDPPIEAAEMLTDALPDRLQRLEPVARLRGEEAHAIRRTVRDSDEAAD